MCISSSPSEHRTIAVVARSGATPCGGYADSSAAGRSAGGGSDDRGFDMPHDCISPTWRCQTIAGHEDPSGGATLQATRGLAYPPMKDRSERPCAGWAQRPTLGYCRQALQEDRPSVAPFVLPRQPAHCSCTVASPAQVARRQIDGLETGWGSRSCVGHRPFTGPCRASPWGTFHARRQPGDQRPVRHHRGGRFTPILSHLLVDRAQLGRPKRSPPHDPREASLREHRSRDAMNAVLPGRSRLAQRRVATIQSGNMPAHVWSSSAIRAASATGAMPRSWYNREAPPRRLR